VTSDRVFRRLVRKVLTRRPAAALPCRARARSSLSW
jgi:hypothetical protein